MEGAYTVGGRLSLPGDQFPCQCRSEHAPPVAWTHRHHIWPLFAGGPDIEANIVVVCPATHDWIHVIWRQFEMAGEILPKMAGWPRQAYQLACLGWRLAYEDEV